MRALAMLWLAGCSSTVDLKWDVAALPAGFDMTCITAVDAIALSEDGFKASADPAQHTASNDRPSCTMVSGLATMSDLVEAVRGKIDLPIPDDGLYGVELRARAGSCTEQTGQAIVSAGGVYAGANVELAMLANLSCATARATVTAMPLDIVKMTTDAAHACAIVHDGAGDLTRVGMLRPSLLTLAQNDPGTMMFESGSSSGVVGGDGNVALVTPISNLASSCTAIQRVAALGGTVCTNEQLQPTVCAAVGAIELPVIADSLARSGFDADLVAQFGPPVVGFVWDKATKAPLANVVVTVSDASRGRVVYASLTSTAITASGGSATDATGTFLVYTSGIQSISATLAGKQKATVFVGAPPSTIGTAMVVMTN